MRFPRSCGAYGSLGKRGLRPCQGLAWTAVVGILLTSIVVLEHWTSDVVAGFTGGLPIADAQAPDRLRQGFRAAMTEYFVRFFVGGSVVSIFPLTGDVLRPKSLAGPFSAAPSVALISLALAISRHGPDYVHMQVTSMLTALRYCSHSASRRAICSRGR